MHDHLGAVLPTIAPDRPWHQRVDADPSAAVRAHLIAAVMGCASCCHLRKGGPQPTFALLPLRRLVCTRCAGIVRRPVTAADECDVCGARGVMMFSPFAVRMGPVIVSGDACQSCADTLGIRREAAS
jgi:hypothetical protein